LILADVGLVLQDTHIGMTWAFHNQQIVVHVYHQILQQQKHHHQILAVAGHAPQVTLIGSMPDYQQLLEVINALVYLHQLQQQQQPKHHHQQDTVLVDVGHVQLDILIGSMQVKHPLQVVINALVYLHHQAEHPQPHLLLHQLLQVEVLHTLVS
jgi:hypothetical protein